MRTSRFHIITAVVTLLVVFSAASRAQGQKSGEQQADRAKAVNAVRLINTAEVTYASGHEGRFGTWKEVWDSGAISTAQERTKMFANVVVSPGAEVIPGFHLDLLVSPDRKSFLLALHDTKDGEGLFSVFSNQSGIIFLGAPPQ